MRIFLRISIAATALALSLYPQPVRAIDPDVQDALLRADWQQLYELIDERDAMRDPILDLVRKQACLCLNEVCQGEGIITELMPEAKDQTKVLGWISKLIEEHPSHAIPQLLAGLAHSIQGNDFVALDYYDSALALDPDLATAYSQRGVIHQIHSDLNSAITDYEKATSLNPSVAKFWSCLGSAYDDMQRFDNAIEAYDRALELMPQAAQVHYNKGNTYRSMGENAAAIDSYSKALDLDADLVPAYYNRGNTYLDLGNVEKARSDFDRAYDHPNSPEEVRRRARSKLMSLENMGSHPKASSDAYRDFLKEGMQAMGMGKIQQAITLYGRAVAQDKTNFKAYGLRALCHAYLELKDSAIDDWGAVIRLCPEDTEPLMERARLYEEIDQPENALADYTRILNINPTDQGALLLRAELYERKHRRLEAIADYRALVEALGGTPSGVAEAVEEAIDLLENGRPPSDLKGLYDRTERFLTARQHGDWEEVAAMIHRAELRRFKSILIPVLESLARDGDYIILRDSVYSVSGFRNMPADRFFVSQMKLLDFDGSPLGFLFKGRFIATTGFQILGSARVSITAAVVPALGGRSQPEAVVYLRDGDGWSLALPLVIAGIAHGMAAEAADKGEYSATAH